MLLSDRMQAVVGLVEPCERIADIGCDHGYVSMELIKRRICNEVIAMDINQGPLQQAKSNIKEYGMQEYIQTRLSDGVEALEPGEADGMICAGMGGKLIIHILTQKREVISQMTQLILQPQSEIDEVRSFLRESGFVIDKEDMVFEDGKYYPMMKAVHKTQLVQEEQGKTMDDLQLRYGPLLLQQKHPVLFAYAKREEMLNLRILDSLKGQRSETAAARIKEVEYELSLIRQVLAKEAASDK